MAAQVRDYREVLSDHLRDKTLANVVENISVTPLLESGKCQIIANYDQMIADGDFQAEMDKFTLDFLRDEEFPRTIDKLVYLADCDALRNAIKPSEDRFFVGVEKVGSVALRHVYTPQDGTGTVIIEGGVVIRVTDGYIRCKRIRYRLEYKSDDMAYTQTMHVLPEEYCRPSPVKENSASGDTNGAAQVKERAFLKLFKETMKNVFSSEDERKNIDARGSFTFNISGPSNAEQLAYNLAGLELKNRLNEKNLQGSSLQIRNNFAVAEYQASKNLELAECSNKTQHKHRQCEQDYAIPRNLLMVA